MAQAAPVKKWTEEEYLAFERASETKHEYFEGELFAMAGGLENHSLIAVNLAAELRAALRGRCRIYNSDFRVRVESTGFFAYPDVSVICGPTESYMGRRDVFTNALLIAEVLSDSTELRDRRFKLEQYRQIPSLQSYLLVSQTAPQIEQYAREAGAKWTYTATIGLKSDLDLPAVGISLRLSEIYADVRFELADEAGDTGGEHGAI